MKEHLHFIIIIAYPKPVIHIAFFVWLSLHATCQMVLFVIFASIPSYQKIIPLYLSKNSRHAHSSAWFFSYGPPMGFSRFFP